MKLILENWRTFLSEQNRGSSRVHVVKKGDTLFKISKKYNIPLSTLLQLNPKFEKPPRDKHKIFPGEKVLLTKQEETIDAEEDEKAVLQDLWLTLSDYVDELISTKKSSIVLNLYWILSYSIIYKLNDKNPNSNDTTKKNIQDSFFEEYYSLLGKFGPGGSPESILNKRKTLKNVVDPLGSESFTRTLESVDITSIRTYENVLLYYFIAKMSSITGLKIGDKQIASVMNPPGRLKEVLTIMRNHEGPIDEEGNSLYAQISSIESGPASGIKKEVLEKIKSYFTDDMISFYKNRTPGEDFASLREKARR